MASHAVRKNTHSTFFPLSASHHNTPAWSFNCFNFTSRLAFSLFSSTLHQLLFPSSFVVFGFISQPMKVPITVFMFAFDCEQKKIPSQNETINQTQRVREALSLITPKKSTPVGLQSAYLLPSHPHPPSSSKEESYLRLEKKSLTKTLFFFNCSNLCSHTLHP